MSLIIGIDGCKSGCFSIWENQDKSIHSSVFSNLNELKNFFKNESQLILGIDMPVVLSEVIPRQADQLARKLLSKNVVGWSVAEPERQPVAIGIGYPR